jgi:hypothetical protein
MTPKECMPFVMAASTPLLATNKLLVRAVILLCSALAGDAGLKLTGFHF